MSFQGSVRDQSHKAHFFKVIVERSLRKGELMIPRSFVKKYSEELSNPVTLRLPNGDKWKVYWTKRDHDIWFNEGWGRFAKYYSLNRGHFLVFRYETGSHFQVMIFDVSGSEIDYWSIRRKDDGENNNSEHYEDAEKSYNAIEIPDESDIPRSPSPQPHKRTKTNGNGEGGNRASSFIAKNCSTNEAIKRRKEAREDAKRRAMNFRSDNPFFLRPLSPSYLQNNLVIPAPFSKEYLEGFNGRATIAGYNEDRTWNVNLKYNVGSNRSIITGWIPFVKECNLKDCDVCVFEMIDRTKFSFKVKIFRASEKSSSEHFQDITSSQTNFTNINVPADT